jgi:hypothetical protein
VCKSLESNWTTLVRTSHISSKAEETPTHAIVFHIYIIQCLPQKELNKGNFCRPTFVGVLGISSAWCLHIFGCRDIFRFIANHCRVVATLRTTYNVTSSLPAKISKETMPKKSIGKKILGTLWDSLDDKSPEEHRLVRRLDCCFLYVRLLPKN